MNMGSPRFGGLPPLFPVVLGIIALITSFSLLFSVSCGSTRRSEPRQRPTAEPTPRPTVRSSPEPAQRPAPREIVRRVHDPCIIPDSLECYLSRSSALIRDHDYERAAQLLLEADQRYPNDAEILTPLGEAYFRLRELPRARYYLERAIQADPDSARACELLDEVSRLMDTAPTSVIIWVQVYDGRIYQHSQITEVRGGLEIESVERHDGRVHVMMRGRVRRDLRYLLVIPYLPDGQHYLTARRR